MTAAGRLAVDRLQVDDDAGQWRMPRNVGVKDRVGPGPLLSLIAKPTLLHSIVDLLFCALCRQ